MKFSTQPVTLGYMTSQQLRHRSFKEEVWNHTIYIYIVYYPFEVEIPPHVSTPQQPPLLCFASLSMTSPHHYVQCHTALTNTLTSAWTYHYNDIHLEPAHSSRAWRGYMVASVCCIFSSCNCHIASFGWDEMCAIKIPLITRSMASFSVRRVFPPNLADNPLVAPG